MDLGTGYLMPFKFARQGDRPGGRERRRSLPRHAIHRHAAIVVSAHYDHVGVRNGEIYPGADDNASGTAALLAIAGLCKKAPWQHDVVFAAFDAEEQGLQGARAFVAAPPIPKERIALNINMDMVSRSATREIYIAGTGYHPPLRQVLEAVAKRSEVDRALRSRRRGREEGPRRLDHAVGPRRVSRGWAFRFSTSVSRIIPTTTSRPTRSTR